MLGNELPSEFAEKWKWRPGTKETEKANTEWTLPGSDWEETEGWDGSARHGLMAHTWGNANKTHK